MYTVDAYTSWDLLSTNFNTIRWVFIFGWDVEALKILNSYARIDWRLCEWKSDIDLHMSLISEVNMGFAIWILFEKSSLEMGIKVDIYV